MAHYAQKGNSLIAAVVAQWAVLAAAPAVAMADLDGDGRADVFVVTGGKAHRYEATGKPGGLTFIPEALGGKVTSVAVGNLDNDPDGRGDLIVGRRAAGSKLGTIWWEPPPLGGNSLLVVTCRFGANVQPNGIAIGASSDWHRMTSTDRGKSWQSKSELRPPGLLAALEIGDGRTVSMGYTTRNTPDPRLKAATVSHSWQNWMTTKSSPSVAQFPFDIERFAFVRSMIRSIDGTKIYAAGHRAAKGGGAMMLESADLGRTWRHRSTIVAKSAPWMGRAGPSETALVRLTNGNLLAVMRTGATSAPIADPPAKCPMAYAISRDDGATWSQPRSMACPGVLPDIALLPDGTVVLLSGRPGVYVRLASADGMTWSQPVFLFGGAGCANSAMQMDADGTLVIAYTESDFCGHEYPGATNYVKMLRMKITD